MTKLFNRKFSEGALEIQASMTHLEGKWCERSVCARVHVWVPCNPFYLVSVVQHAPPGMETHI